MKRRKDIIDGRGRATPLYVDRKPMPRPDRLGKDRERRIRRNVLRAVLGRRWWRGVIALAAVLGGAAAFGRFSSPLIRMLSELGVHLLVGSFFAVTPYLLVLVVIVLALRPDKRSIAFVFTEERICPSCLYDLQSLPAQDDGCTVCPECGAAWRLA